MVNMARGASLEQKKLLVSPKTVKRVLAPVPLANGKHPVISWFAVQSIWELISLAKTSNLPVLLLLKMIYVKRNTKPLFMIFLYL